MPNAKLVQNNLKDMSNTTSQHSASFCECLPRVMAILKVWEMEMMRYSSY